MVYNLKLGFYAPYGRMPGPGLKCIAKLNTYYLCYLKLNEIIRNTICINTFLSKPNSTQIA